MNSHEEYRKNAYERALQDSEERKRQEQQQAEALKKETQEVNTPTEQPKDTNNILVKTLSIKNQKR